MARNEVINPFVKLFENELVPGGGHRQFQKPTTKGLQPILPSSRNKTPRMPIRMRPMIPRIWTPGLPPVKISPMKRTAGERVWFILDTEGQTEQICEITLKPQRKLLLDKKLSSFGP
eukprot:14658299-Heterocapsa_arctica.AAC.1